MWGYFWGYITMKYPQMLTDSLCKSASCPPREKACSSSRITYPLRDHLKATHPDSKRPALAMILRAASDGDKVHQMVNALCTEIDRRDQGNPTSGLPSFWDWPDDYFYSILEGDWSFDSNVSNTVKNAKHNPPISVTSTNTCITEPNQGNIGASLFQSENGKNSSPYTPGHAGVKSCSRVHPGVLPTTMDSVIV